MRVLVVDDDPGSRAIVRRVAATALQFQTDEASNGLECLEALQRRAYALVVLDLQMPLVGGIQALEVIRSTPALAHIPVVVLTGGADEDHVRKALSLGVSAYLAKPINPEQLAARLVQVGRSLLPPGHDAHRPGDTLAIVCGPDADYRKRLAHLLASDFWVEDVDRFDDLLRIVGEPHEAWRARVIVCSVDAAREPHDEIVARLRTLDGGATVTLFAAVPREEVSAAKRSGLWDGVLSSAMPPTMFASQFVRLCGTAAASRPHDDDILAAG